MMMMSLLLLMIKEESKAVRWRGRPEPASAAGAAAAHRRVPVCNRSLAVAAAAAAHLTTMTTTTATTTGHRRRLPLLALLLSLLAAPSCSDEHDHRYEDNAEVVLWVNTVGPYHNRQETYSYFSLPFCPGPKQQINHYHETLGEALQGVELEFSGLDIDFKHPISRTQFCSVVLDAERLAAFMYAVRNLYWYQMYVDDLPIWGIVGDVSDSDPDALFVYTHKRLDFGFNGERIVDVNLTSEGKTRLELGATLAFTYEVSWSPSAVAFEDRFDKYLDASFFQHRIHWFSIFNSFMMVIFLIGLVSMILMRTLRKDYARYSRDDDMNDLERDLGDEYGWKQVHGDVFRPPSYPMLLSVFVGTGYQVATVAFFVIVIAIFGSVSVCVTDADADSHDSRDSGNCTRSAAPSCPRPSSCTRPRRPSTATLAEGEWTRVATDSLTDPWW